MAYSLPAPKILSDMQRGRGHDGASVSAVLVAGYFGYGVAARIGRRTYVQLGLP